MQVIVLLHMFKQIPECNEVPSFSIVNVQRTSKAPHWKTCQVTIKICLMLEQCFVRFLLYQAKDSSEW